MSGRLSSKMIKSTFKAKYSNLDVIRNMVGRSAQQAGFSDREVYEVQLAADEASANIIQHAFGGEGLDEFEIECDVTPGKLIITLHDRGKPFDPASVPEPNVKAGLRDRQVGGLGMYLIRNLMDEVHYTTSIEKGNTLKLVKYAELEK